MRTLRVLTDETLDQLGNYFTHYHIYEKYGLTFEAFLDRWARGTLNI